MAQTVINDAPDRAFAGMPGDVGGGTYNRSLAIEGATTKFGYAVVAGTDPAKQAILPSAAGQSLQGVVLHQHATQDPNASDLVVGEVASVARKGRVWVPTDEVVAAGDPVFYRHTAGTTALIGTFRNDADTATADAVTNASFLDYDASTGLALLELNLP